ncbi:DNA-3-methyladenine glycosylase II [Halalkaliarchaeum desulfuricum]|uniref:DNA-3-methyladenine glycosylase II n=1 Tax=Halalkaliarchaeum desulfuricum TaxID=2055893 RepID=A0A343TFG4_9EURY|nr:DNA-3-methyladenine glycosylase [Halalkaliarchaeum desulfuricum]AUX07836.1 DNA-3-methyladenine glycosylase II [Halalkaliarchaeum desulfuricum]
MQPLNEDSVMAELIEVHGDVTVEPAEDMFRRMTVSIINQQLSTASARAIRERVFDHVEVTPEGILTAEPEELHDLGLSESKVEYLKNVADAHVENGYSVAYFEGMTDEDVIAELTEIRGVGTWTAKMALIFCLGREDVFPVEDLGIRRGMETAYGITERDAMVQKAEEWAPYRSYASRYLWRAVD